MVPLDLQTERYELADYSVPALSVSASVDASEKLHITLSNASPHKDIVVKVFVRGMKVNRVQGRVLQAGTMNAHNTFENPNAVQPNAFNGAQVCEDGLELVMPKMSVVVLETT